MGHFGILLSGLYSSRNHFTTCVQKDPGGAKELLNHCFSGVPVLVDDSSNGASQGRYAMPCGGHGGTRSILGGFI